MLSFIQHHFCSLRTLDRYVACSLHSATILCSSSDNYFARFQGFELTFTQVLEDFGFIYRPGNLLRSLFGHNLSGKGEDIVYCRVVMSFIQYDLRSLGNLGFLFLHHHLALSLHSATILCSSCDNYFSCFQGFELTISDHVQNTGLVQVPRYLLVCFLGDYASTNGEDIVYGHLTLDGIQYHFFTLRCFGFRRLFRSWGNYRLCGVVWC